MEIIVRKGVRVRAFLVDEFGSCRCDINTLLNAGNIYSDGE